LVECNEQYWDFVAKLRMDERVLDGFIGKMVKITPVQQIAYMTKYSDCFRIALLKNEPVGYFGVIEDDIRICVHPAYQKRGIGKFLVNSCFGIWPTALAKVKVTNIPSQNLFESCGYKLAYYLYTREELMCLIKDVRSMCCFLRERKRETHRGRKTHKKRTKKWTTTPPPPRTTST